MNARELMAQRAAKIAEAKTIASAPAMNDEQRAKLDGLLKEAETMKGDIARLSVVETEDAALDQSNGLRAAGNEPPSAPAFNKMPRGDDEMRAFLHYLRTGQVNQSLTYRGHPENRASNATDLNIGTSADGGYLVPTALYNKIIAKRNESMLRDKLGIQNIGGTETTMNVPYDNGTANEFVATTEANAFDLDGPAFGQNAMTYVYYTKQQKLSYQLLNSQSAGLESFLSNYVGAAYARTHNSLLLAALLAGGTAFTMAAAGAATDTDIPGIVYSLPDGYQDSAAFLMRRATEGSYKALKGSVFQFNPTPAGGERSFWGYPVFNTGYAEAIATGKKSVVFGNFNFVLNRESPEMTMLRDPYSAAGTGQVNVWYYFATVYKVAIAEAIRIGAHP